MSIIYYSNKSLGNILHELTYKDVLKVYLIKFPRYSANQLARCANLKKKKKSDLWQPEIWAKAASVTAAIKTNTRDYSVVSQ